MAFGLDVAALDGRSIGDACLVNGDCVDVVRQMPANSVGLSIYSPPFGNLFTYSASAADMGNSADDDEFFEHYAMLIKEMARVTKPGRHSAVHCSELPFTKWKDGMIGLKDFPGMIIRAHEEAGFVLHSRVTIWRDPVVEMTRTKALGLLYKQLQADSTKSRVGMPDYLCVFRAPSENAEPVMQRPADFPVSLWQKWASPVWMDIRQTDTLNAAQARDGQDERHICPLQLGLIERAVTMWSNPGDVVLSPFMGIGSEGFVSVKKKRRFVGVELKDSYFKAAVRNIEIAQASSDTLLDGLVLEDCAC